MQKVLRPGVSIVREGGSRRPMSGWFLSEREAYAHRGVNENQLYGAMSSGSATRCSTLPPWTMGVMQQA